MVDQAAALGLIDELRVAVPEEVRAAKRINSEGERIIEKAQEEAERIVAPGPGAGRLPDRRARPDRAGRGRQPADHRATPSATRRMSGAAPTSTRSTSSSGSRATSCKTLQSIKRGIELLDTRRTDLRADEQDGAGPDDRLDDEIAIGIDEDEGATVSARR